MEVMATPAAISRVGFIGLGRMGRPMALNLLAAGFSVSVISRSPGPVADLTAAGAAAAGSHAALARIADIVVTCLPDVETCERVYLGTDGLAANARHGQIFVETSTIGPRHAREVAAALEERGAHYLDAPVSGGVERATDGTLTVMVGGDARALEMAMPVLRTIGANVQHVGGVGQGCVVKLTNQLLVAVHTLAACEAMLLGMGAGADSGQLLEVLGSSWGNSVMLGRTGPMVASGDYGSRAPMRLLTKDMALVQELAEELGLELPLGERTRSLLDEAMRRGMAEVDVAALAMLVSEARSTDVAG
ncbi:MAG: NAD(P)-dependent oxidoreductase [Dehalococcoidia bacterium]